MFLGFEWLCMRLLMYVARLRFESHMCMDCTADVSLFFCLVCACTLILRVIVCAFAFACCKVAFHITRVCISHAHVVFLLLVCLCVLV